MENESIVDSADELHLFSVHYIFLPRVQRAAAEFLNQWNTNRLSIQGGQTRHQQGHRGVFNSVGAGASSGYFFTGNDTIKVSDNIPL